MKKYFITFIFIAIFIPSVAFASWWNPFSWFNGWTFHKEETSIEYPVQKITTPANTTTNTNNVSNKARTPTINTEQKDSPLIEKNIPKKDTVQQQTPQAVPPPVVTPPPQVFSTQNTNPVSQPPAQTTKIELWKFDGTSWQPEGVAPTCPTIIFRSPVDLSKATSILYPGQYRGGNYKSHGGFRFDNSKSSDVPITAPLDAYLFRGSRYLEFGEVQYLLDFMTPCGFAYRFDHMLALSPKYAEIANTFPEPTAADSRTTNIQPVFTKTGEIIATATGHEKSPNANQNVGGADWGVYDLRQTNKAAQDATWRASHPEGQFGWYALCWFDLLTPEDSAKVRSLPAGDSVNGKQSDFCK